MSVKSFSGGQYGSAAAAISATFVGDYEPSVLLFKQFSATGATASIAVPNGVSQVTLQMLTTGAPTSASVVAQGSNDGGNSWTNLPGVAPAGSPTFRLIRLNCTALSGGTSPTLVVAGLATP